MTPEEQQEDRRQMAVDVLNGIDNTNMNSDGLIRHAMDLMSNYGYRTYRKAMRTVLEYFNRNPSTYRNDTPTRYTYMGQLWREEYPDAYQAYQEKLRVKREAQKIAEEKTVVNQLMSDLAHDLVNREHFSLIGFEPTDGEGQ